MLSPDERHLFLQALRPPEGYSFDSGIGTTFTLDLYTLLITPLSLALFDRNSTEQALSDPLSLLESLRRYASRLTIFCQAGRINLPKETHPLMSYLESMIVEVQAPRGGVFHPKLWLLRYTSMGKPPLYRLLNLSRNLTFDRSWDMILQMEGELRDRKVGFSRNRPLSDFFQALPQMAIHPINQAVTDRVNLLQDEVRRVEFKPPTGFNSNITFHPIGIPGYRPFQFQQSIGRLLIISPFLNNDFLEKITNQGQNHLLISHLDSIDELKEKVRGRFEKIFIMNEMAEEDPRESSTLSDDDIDEDEHTLTPELSGLHAKLFIWETGWGAGWLIGSANATDAAFRKNVEFMIELHGKKSEVGINKVIGNEDDRNSLRKLLLEYIPPEQKALVNKDQKRVEDLTNTVCDWLLSCQFTLGVQPKGDQYDLYMRSSRSLLRPVGEYSIKCRPISLREDATREFNINQSNLEIYFKGLSLVSLTAFIGFEVKAQVGKEKYSARFVFLLPISDLPQERDSAILATILSDRIQFLHYLRLILMDDSEIDHAGLWTVDTKRSSHTSSGWEDLEMPLLEELVHALSRSNETGGKIDRIAELIERLNYTQNGRTIIPSEFMALWQIILQARQEL